MTFLPCCLSFKVNAHKLKAWHFGRNDVPVSSRIKAFVDFFFSSEALLRYIFSRNYVKNLVSKPAMLWSQRLLPS